MDNDGAAVADAEVGAGAEVDADAALCEGEDEAESIFSAANRCAVTTFWTIHQNHTVRY
jgi:hypothetical protein